MPPRRSRRTRGTPNIGEQSEIPHPLPQSEESECYESAHEDSAECENTSKMPNISKTASKSRDTNMATRLGITGAASELLRIKDGLNQLKPANFKCELLNYDNVKTWKTWMKQLLSLQEC